MHPDAWATLTNSDWITMSTCCSKDTCSTTTASATLDAKDVPSTAAIATFRIEQMDCPTEERLIRKKLEGQTGVFRLDFDLLERILVVHHGLPDTSTLEKGLQSIGMKPVRLDGSGPDADRARGMSWKEKTVFIIGGASAFLAEATGWLTGKESSWPVAILSVCSVAAVGLPTLKKGWFALRERTLNINFLMSVAVLGALAIQKWPEAAMVTFLFAVAEGIERLSLENARNAIRSLAGLAPETAEIWDGTSWRDVPSNSVEIDARLRLRTGSRVPLDSRLTSGSLSINEAPITGESLPVDKFSGDLLFAGTIIVDGSGEAQVTATAGASTLAQIADAIQQAQKQRAPTQRFVDVFARYYTPAVFLLALLVMLVGGFFGEGGAVRWVYEGLVILVVACPCALVISTPVTVVSGISAAAKRGILVKGGAYLESGAKIRVIGLDKTGTLTSGKPTLSTILTLGSMSRGQALLMAASLDEQSTHPVARAVVNAFRQENPDRQFESVDDFKVLPGRGVVGTIESRSWHLGNHRLVEDLGVCSSALEDLLKEVEQRGQTALVLTGPGGPVAVFGVGDQVRAESEQAVSALNNLRIHPVLLTGDNSTTAQVVAAQVGIKEAHGNLLPADKEKKVLELRARFGSVGMVGDGINDAPALASADIGFAMGAAGTATALETADVAIMDDDLSKVGEFVRLSVRTRAVLKQNIAIALVIKAVFLSLALTHHATLWMAVFADMGGSLLVVGNGLRLTRGVAFKERLPSAA